MSVPNSIVAQLEPFTQEPVGKSKTARIDGNQRRRVMSSLPGRCVKNKVICSFPCKNLFEVSAGLLLVTVLLLCVIEMASFGMLSMILMTRSGIHRNPGNPWIVNILCLVICSFVGI